MNLPSYLFPVFYPLDPRFQPLPTGSFGPFPLSPFPAWYIPISPLFQGASPVPLPINLGRAHPEATRPPSPLSGRVSRLGEPSLPLKTLPPSEEIFSNSSEDTCSQKENTFPPKEYLFTTLRSRLESDTPDSILFEIANYFGGTEIPKILPYKPIFDYIATGVEDILKYEPSISSETISAMKTLISPHLLSIIEPHLNYTKLTMKSFKDYA